MDDGNPCTADACDPATGTVTHTALPVGTSCSDGNACNGLETCNGNGVCQAGTPIAIDDGNPCTADACDPATGVVSHTPLPAGTSCSDGNACNGIETCDGNGICRAIAPTAIDDGDPCTTDTCDPLLGVGHTRIPGCVYTPPDPATLATPLSKSSVTSFADSVSFLYSPPAPIQFGVDPSVFDSKRIAVLRGRVFGLDGLPIGGTLVRALSHPEFGYTYTRVDGRFDLAVNGGARVTLDYFREGFVPAQRTIDARWNEYGVAPDLTLVPYDAQATAVTLGAATIQVARGSPVSDSRGSRQATVMFPPNIQAGMVLPNGTSQPLTSLTVRATEYTANSLDAGAMPGELPASSGFTYAVELSVDEATVAGATDVQFNQPLPVYLDNFLGFPVGGPVPTGYYDRGAGAWTTSVDGRVISVLDVSGGTASLDVDGTGFAADATKLTALGITDGERAQLAQLYGPGKSLWRVLVSHFTPWDFNWPFGCSGVCPDPSLPPPPDHNPPCQSTSSGSVIECQGQVLGEDVPVAGTPYGVHYKSDRTPGFTRSVKIPITGDAVPQSLMSIAVRGHIAGQTITQQFFPPFTPNQLWSFTWDGKDAYGRRVLGKALLNVQVIYLYPGIYNIPQFVWCRDKFGLITTDQTCSFSFFGVTLSGFNVTAPPFPRVQEVTAWLGAWDGRAAGLGGWSLSPHHVFDPVGQVLYLGDGTSRHADALPRIIETIAGGGSNKADGIPAIQASIPAPTAVKTGADGSVYFTTELGLYAYAPSMVRRRDPQGTIWTVAGTRGACSEFVEGIPATQLCLGVDDLSLGPDGSVYVTDFHRDSSSALRARVVRIGSDGLAHAVAGTGPAGFSGDGGLATAAQIERTYGLSFGPDGAIYLLSQGRLRKIDPSGIIVTIGGNGTCSSAGDGGPAINARFCAQGKLAIGPDGSIYLPDTINRRVRKITPDGVIRTFAGTGGYPYSPYDDVTSALSVALGYTSGIVLDRDEFVYVGETFSYGNYTFARIRRIAPDGTTSKFSGANPGGFGGDGGPAAKALISSPIGLALGPDGTIYVADYYNARIRAIRPPPVQSSGGEMFVASDDGAQLFVFDGEGRHLRTVDTRNNVILYAFGYTSDGWLASITDRDGLITRIDRDGQGEPTAIVAPYGQRTALAVDAGGYLNSVANPAGEAFSMTYDPLGLLQTFTDPRNQTHNFAFSPDGRLVRDANPAGGEKDLASIDNANSYRVSLTSAFDATRSLVSLYGVQQLANGDRVMTDTKPDGVQTATRFALSGDVTVTRPDGTVITWTQSPDPRFGLQSPLLATTIAVPSGLQQSSSQSRLVVLSDPKNLLSVTSITDTATVNGRNTVTTYDTATRRGTLVTPASRTTAFVLDEKGRVVHVEPPGYPAVYAIDTSYDALGRLQAMGQGSRATTITYDTSGLPSTLLDPLNRATRMTFDAAGRASTLELPGPRLASFGYDRNGNMTSLAPPGRGAHGFTYDAVDRLERYDPPLVAGLSSVSTSYAYTLNGDPAGTWLPDGTSAVPAYETNGSGQLTGRVAAVTDARGTISITYDAAGRVATLTTPEGQALGYAYDGHLLASETASGIVAGTVALTHDNDFRVTGVSVNGSTATFDYDPDGLLTRAGAMTVTREPASGRVSGTSLGAVTTAVTYDGYGAAAHVAASSNGQPVYSYDLGFDPAGRITSRTEQIAGVSTTYDYGYDAAGRLSDVTVNGQLKATYLYDSNGNLLRKTSTVDGIQEGSTDEQDRLLSFGAASFSYGPNGDLTAKTIGGATTRYSYDRQGNLLWVTLPDGNRIDYVVDGRSRRVGKKVNGALVEGFLYDGQLRPVAWLDGAGAVKATFVYGLHVNVPEYMTTSAGTFRILTDHLGSPRLVVDSTSDAVVQKMDYDSFGQVLSDTSRGFQPFGFGGGLYDRDTGLVRFGARDYDPSTGRWTNKDPARFNGGDPNLYAYVFNDPVNWIDPTGLDGQQAPDDDANIRELERKLNARNENIKQLCKDVQKIDGNPLTYNPVPPRKPGPLFPLTIWRYIRIILPFVDAADRAGAYNASGSPSLPQPPTPQPPVPPSPQPGSGG